MGDQKAAAIGGLVHGIHADANAAESEPAEGASEFVMIARDIGNQRAAMRHLEQPSDHAVVRVGPMPALFQSPHIDDVTDKKHRFALDMLECARELLRLRAARAEVAITQK